MKHLLCVIFCFSFFSLKAHENSNYIRVTGTYNMDIDHNKVVLKVIVDKEGNKDIRVLEDQILRLFSDIGMPQNRITIKEGKHILEEGIFLDKQRSRRVYFLELLDLGLIDEVFYKLIKIGVSEVFIYEVTHTDIEKFRAQALTKAVENAKEQAVLIAAALGQSYREG